MTVTQRFILAFSISLLLSLTGCMSQKASVQEFLQTEGEHPKSEESPLASRTSSFPDVAPAQPPELAAEKTSEKNLQKDLEETLAKTLELDVQVAPWYQFHHAALSLTFDDGTLDQYLVAYPELERRNLKATFFLLTDYVDDGVWTDFQSSRRLMNWDQARELAENGHEIGSHGHTHRELLDGEHIEEELRLSQAIIEREIPTQRCISLSWPFWRSSSAGRRLAEKHYAAARAGGADPERYLTRNGDVLSSEPDDLFEIGCMGILSNEALLWSEAGETVYQSGSWVVICLHGVDDGSLERDALGWQAISLSSFQALLDYIEAQDLWIAPFGYVVRYIRERQNIEVRILERTDDRLVFSATDGLDDTIYNQPLSLRLTLPKGGYDVRVLQGLRLLPSRRDANGDLYIDVVPDQGLVRIIRKADHSLVQADS